MKLGNKTRPRGNNESGSSGSGVPHRISGDTKWARLDSWLAIARSHMELAGGYGFVIRNLEGQRGSLETRAPHTLPQWLAWMDYLDRNQVPHAFLDSFGLGTMPCEWPWLFDMAEEDRGDHWRAQAGATLRRRETERSKRVMPNLHTRSMAVRKLRQRADEMAERGSGKTTEPRPDYSAPPSLSPEVLDKFKPATRTPQNLEEVEECLR